MSKAKAIFVVSQKGGSGKSTFARGLVDIHRQRQKQKILAYDADGGVGQLLQFYGIRGDGDGGALEAEQDPENGVGYFDVRVQTDNLVNLLDQAEEKAAKIVLVDFPGGSLDALENFGDGAGVRGIIDEYNEAGYEVTVVVVISNKLASAKNVMQTLNSFDMDVDFVVVKNMFFGSDFPAYEGFRDSQGQLHGGKGRKLLLKRGGVEVQMPRLRGNEDALIDMFHLPFSAASADARLPRASKRVVKDWIAEFRASLDPAAKLLGLENDGEEQ